jgi:hypothetical protein
MIHNVITVLRPYLFVVFILKKMAIMLQVNQFCVYYHFPTQLYQPHYIHHHTIHRISQDNQLQYHNNPSFRQ